MQLTLGSVGVLFFRVVRAEELQELVALDLQVVGELFRGQEAGHGLPEGVSFPLEQRDGTEVVFGEGAGPGVA